MTKPNPTTPARLPWSGWKVEPDKRNLFFEEVRKSAPDNADANICKTGPNVEAYAKYDYEAWFNYFYREARKATGNSSEFQLDTGRMFSLMFDLQTQGTGNGTKILVSSPCPAPLSAAFRVRLASTGDPIPGAILEYLFKLGFEEAKLTTAGDYLGKMLALQSNMSDGVAVRSQKGEFVFGYRGDSRDIATIKIQKGASCRADLERWRSESSLDEHWHPWKDAAKTWEKMWFRKGGKDNDYFTMNSIAKEFHIACAYPMFKAFEVSQSLKGPADTWDTKQQAILTPKGMELREVYNTTKAKWETVPRDETRIFVCAFSAKTEAATTYELANYPETAVRTVGLEDMIAYLTVQRYHHFPGGTEPFYDSTRAQPSMTVRVKSWTWFRTEEETRAYLGCTQDGIRVISAKMQNLVGKMFDIDHNNYRGAATLQINRDKAVGSGKPQEKQPVRLTAR
ncbi:MAG: hypothetical protein R3E97_11560 [Candidatus Eisenbacteria bacterium]